MPGSRSSNNESEHKSPRESGDDSEDESEILEESPCGRWLKRKEEVSFVLNRKIPFLMFGNVQWIKIVYEQTTSFGSNFLPVYTEKSLKNNNELHARCWYLIFRAKNHNKTQNEFWLTANEPTSTSTSCYWENIFNTTRLIISNDIQGEARNFLKFIDVR